MAKFTGILANLPGGITKLFHRLHDGDWVHESVQDCDPILDANKAEQNSDNPLKHGDMQMVARIPFIVIEKWRNELGVDYWNPNHQDKVDQLLDSSDWRWLRVDGGNNHNVSFSGLNIGPDSPVFQAPKQGTKVLDAGGAPMKAAH